MSVIRELGVRKSLSDLTWTVYGSLSNVYALNISELESYGCDLSNMMIGPNSLRKFIYSRKNQLIGRLSDYDYFIDSNLLCIYLSFNPSDPANSDIQFRTASIEEISYSFDELGTESMNTLVAKFITNNSTSLIDGQGDLVIEYKSNAPYHRQWLLSELDGSVTLRTNGIGELFSISGVAAQGGSVSPSSNTVDRLEALEKLTEPATDKTLGTIIVGKYLDITKDGVLNVTIPGDVIFKGGCKLVDDEGSDVHIYDMSDKPIIDFESGFKYLIEEGEYDDPYGTHYTKGDYIIVNRDATDSTEHLTVADVVFVNSQESDVAKLPLNNVFTGTSNTFDGNLLVNGSTTLNGSTDVMDIEYVGTDSGSTVVTEDSSKLVTSGAVYTAVYNEKSRAESKEAELDTAISNEVTRATGVENQLRTDLIQESTDRATQDGILQSNINGLQSSKVDKTTTIAGVDLQDNITKSELLTALNVEDGAQVNIIESIKVNGTQQSITEKSIDITVPTGALASKDVVAEDDLSNELKAKINEISGIEGNVLSISQLLYSLNSFDEDNKLTQLVDAALDSGTSSMNFDVDTVTDEGLVDAFIEFLDCIGNDDTDTGLLINQLRNFYKTNSDNPNLTEDKNLNKMTELLIELINIFRYSMDYGPITTVIKSSNGLAKLRIKELSGIKTYPTKDKVANALLFIISRFSDNDVEIVSYTTEIDGGSSN